GVHLHLHEAAAALRLDGDLVERGARVRHRLLELAGLPHQMLDVDSRHETRLLVSSCCNRHPRASLMRIPGLAALQLALTPGGARHAPPETPHGIIPRPSKLLDLRD